MLEQLEDRVLLSGNLVVDQPDYILFHPPGYQPFQSASPVGFTPQQIQTAYGINQLYGPIGNGAGQTIAIIDAYNDPNIIPDTNAFSKQFNLPQFNISGGPTLTVLNQTGGTTLPGTDPAGPPNDWEAEESLDVEWAHAIAPGANIIVFEANSDSPSDLDTAIATAADYPSVSVVSMSFGGPESSSDPSSNSLFTTPPGHQGVTFLASSGDNGSYVPGTTTVAVNYPAASPNVIGVGGTSLTLNPDNSYNSETAWGNGTQSGTLGGSGGGISQFEPEPAYQESVQQTGFRTVPDVAFDADPNTGVAVYDSYDNGASTPWAQVGGTSLAAPSWAGLIAIADEGLAEKGEPTLDGPSQTLPDLYHLYQTNPGDFHDITSGSNGAYSAGPGYDEVTGLGSPVANLLIPALIGGSPSQVTLTSAVEGQPLTNVPVATLIDNTGVPITSATIDWGDGTTPTSGTLVAGSSPNTFIIEGSHTYAEEGNYTLTVSASNGTSMFTTSGVVHVADAPLNGAAQSMNTQAGGFVSNALVAIFTDTDTFLEPASNYSATVQWFEGNGLSVVSNGVIQQVSGNTFAVYASSPFSFPSGGLFTAQVVVRDVGGASVVINSVVNVASNPAIPPLVPVFQGDDGPPDNSPFVAMEDALGNLLKSEHLFLLAMSFGTPSEQIGALLNLLNAYIAYKAAVFAYDMSLPGA